MPVDQMPSMHEGHVGCGACGCGLQETMAKQEPWLQDILQSLESFKDTDRSSFSF